MFPKPIESLLAHFQKLPGIGPKQAARFSFRLLSMHQDELDKFGQDIRDIKRKITVCRQCFLTYAKDENILCQFCRNPHRDQAKICVVETERDALTVENAKTYSGVYHILGKNVFNASSGSRPIINALVKRIIDKDFNLELIFAMNATPDGQATSLWIEKLINEAAIKEAGPKKKNIKITRLGRGLSSGIEIEYADKDTLVDAFQNRK